jgi:hypothetical protein
LLIFGRLVIQADNVAKASQKTLFSSSSMANPRQRRKSRAGNRGKPTGNALRRLHNKLNRAPTLKGPEALQQKWDKKKTVFQK